MIHPVFGGFNLSDYFTYRPAKDLSDMKAAVIDLVLKPRKIASMHLTEGRKLPKVYADFFRNRYMDIPLQLFQNAQVLEFSAPFTGPANISGILISHGQFRQTAKLVRRSLTRQLQVIPERALLRAALEAQPYIILIQNPYSPGRCILIKQPSKESSSGNSSGVAIGAQASADMELVFGSEAVPLFTYLKTARQGLIDKTKK